MAGAEFKSVNYPEAKAYEIPYVPPPPPSNPVVRGLPLHYGAKLISSVPLIQSFLWTNAGFNALRGKPELVNVEPRYDPAVVRSPRGEPSDGSTLDDVLTSAEYWSSKRPSAALYASALDYHEAYKSGRLTPTAVAEALLPLVRRDVPKPSRHATAFIDSKVDLVLKAAEESTARYKSGQWRSIFDGVPVAVKDEVDLEGYMKCLGSTRDYTPKDNITSFCVQKWIEAGAVIVGKLNMHELGLDTTNNNPNYGTPLNPHNEHYYTGGSSGGSAYAVAAGLIPISLGADGGGSIRIPSAYCGFFGLKPSHGRVSGRPSASLASTTGVLGPMAANMLDLELAYRIMAQPDPLDPTSSLFAPPCTALNKTKTLGIYRTWFDRADAAVQKACWIALDYLRTTHGYTITDISLPLIHAGQMAHAMTILAEIASSNPHTADLTAPNKVLLSVGVQTPAVDFLQAQRLRHLLMQHLAHLFAAHPGLMIITPTTPNAGWHISNSKLDLQYGVSDGNMSVRSMEYVWMANFCGLPALSVPVGYVQPVEGTGEVPVGLMAMGEWCCEDALIGFGYDAEKWLHEGLQGGRRRPETFVDAAGLAGTG